MDKLDFIDVFIDSLEAWYTFTRPERKLCIPELPCSGLLSGLYLAVFPFHRKDTHIEPEIKAQKVVTFEGAAQHQVEQQL